MSNLQPLWASVVHCRTGSLEICFPHHMGYLCDGDSLASGLPVNQSGMCLVRKVFLYPKLCPERLVYKGNPVDLLI